MSKYCIVATCKTTNIRKRISLEYDNKEQAERNLKNYTDSISRRAFKYAKVVKSPYTPCKGGEGWCHKRKYMERFSVEQYAADLFTSKFGIRLDTRFDKLREEVDELFESYENYMKGNGTKDHVIDELSDVEAVLLHIRSIISYKSHEESILDAVLKVKIREHNKNYKK